jgi:hypothetical protein
LGFVANILGLTNTFSGPQLPLFLTAGVAALAFIAATACAVVQAPREKDPVLRGLLHLNWIFFIGVAGLFVIVARRGNENNYIVCKFILGFDWIAYLNVGLLVLAVVRWRPRLLPATALLMLFVSIGAARTSVWFLDFLLQDSKSALFLQGDAAVCRRLLGPNAKVYVGATRVNFAIVGQFIAHDRDLLSVNGYWPDGSHQAFAPSEPVLQTGVDYKLENDSKVHGKFQAQWVGHCVVLVRPAGVTPVE